MKGLLHSKLFRKNLFKWLFMYITVIGLFTSVVTYSKYISNLQTNSSARPAKFDADIKYDVCPELMDNNICDIGTFRPTSTLSYYFTVDATNIEVSAVFATVIEVNEQFKNIKIYDITNTKKELTAPNDMTKNGNKYTIVKDIEPNENYIRNYEITMEFDHENYDYDYSSKHNITGVLKVGYSAVQKD